MGVFKITYVHSVGSRPNSFSQSSKLFAMRIMFSYTGNYYIYMAKHWTIWEHQHPSNEVSELNIKPKFRDFLRFKTGKSSVG